MWADNIWQFHFERLLVAKFRAKYSDILRPTSRAYFSDYQQLVKNWAKTVQAHGYQIKEKLL